MNTCVLFSWEWKFHLKKVKGEILWGKWSENSWVPGLWDLMADDLRSRWCDNNRNKMHSGCNVLESPPNRLLCPVHGNISSVRFSHSVMSTPCDPMDGSIPDFPVHHQLLELAQTHVHWVGDAIQPSHPLSSPSFSAFNLSQHQGLFQWVGSSQQVAKVLELQLQHQSLQWIFMTWKHALLQNWSLVPKRLGKAGLNNTFKTTTSFVFTGGFWACSQDRGELRHLTIASAGKIQDEEPLVPVAADSFRKSWTPVRTGTHAIKQEEASEVGGEEGREKTKGQVKRGADKDTFRGVQTWSQYWERKEQKM